MGWVKHAAWLEGAMAGPGRPRGRLSANWSQKLHQQNEIETIKIPKKRGPKPGTKVYVTALSLTEHFLMSF